VFRRSVRSHAADVTAVAAAAAAAAAAAGAGAGAAEMLSQRMQRPMYGGLFCWIASTGKRKGYVGCIELSGQVVFPTLSD